MESPTTFGEWLSQSRKGLRLTREELARMLSTPNENRLHFIVHALEQEWSVEAGLSVSR